MYLPHGGLAQSRHLMLEIKGRHLVGLSKFGKHRQPSINHYTLPILLYSHLISILETAQTHGRQYWEVPSCIRVRMFI